MRRLTLMRLIYSVVITLLLPALFLRLWFKGKKSPDYRKRWAERLGWFDSTQCISGGICFHCVSVGETLAAVPLIKQVQQQYPQLQITVTSTTPTGSARVKAAFGDSVFHVYLPFDTPGAVKRFFNKIKPQLLVIVETELWPNLLHYASQFQCQTLLANARLSARSAKGYKNKITTLSAGMMADLSCVAAHHHDDGERFCQLGLAPDKLQVIGSIKFDVNIDPAMVEQAQALKNQWAANRPVWVVGSTHQGEDELILQAFNQILQQQPNTLLILVPRHPERFEQVKELISQNQLNLITRSSGQTPQAETAVVLGDTMGELMLFWAMADVAFVGGSLVARGGHNPLEPAAFGVPVLSGIEVFNFAAIYQLLEQHQAVTMVNEPQQLGQTVVNLLQNPALAKQLGSNALTVVNQNRGALKRLNQQIAQLLSNHKKVENL
jgi:3-deoxy-D-manno-octulosonic-acid transferase